MAMIGYAAALEQFHPTELLEYSQLAEQHGFGGIMAADHFQPWVPQQGHNGYVWSWMAALGATTKTVTFGPGVNCPSFRYHPAIIAQAAATQATARSIMITVKVMLPSLFSGFSIEVSAGAAAVSGVSMGRP